MQKRVVCERREENGSKALIKGRGKETVGRFKGWEGKGNGLGATPKECEGMEGVRGTKSIVNHTGKGKQEE